MQHARKKPGPPVAHPAARAARAWAAARVERGLGSGVDAAHVPCPLCGALPGDAAALTAHLFDSHAYSSPQAAARTAAGAVKRHVRALQKSREAKKIAPSA